jgi:hypothetical protein
VEIQNEKKESVLVVVFRMCDIGFLDCVEKMSVLEIYLYSFVALPYRSPGNGRPDRVPVICCCHWQLHSVLVEPLDLD